MNYILSVVSGACVSIMILYNGWLSSAIGAYPASILFNIGACLFVLLICLIKKQWFTGKKIPWYIYFGGIANVFTVVFNNLAFGKISVSSILAISLLGQALVSALIDHFGLFDMPKIPFKPIKLLAYAAVILGIAILLFPVNSGASFAIIISFLTGFCVIAARVINAEYSKQESVMISTFLNYAIGVVGIILISKIFYNVSAVETIKLVPTINPILLLGAIFGVATITLNNYISPRISSYYLTLFIFVGQVFSGIICDIVIDGTFSTRNLIGGFVVLVGLILNIYIDNYNTVLVKSN